MRIWSTKHAFTSGIEEHDNAIHSEDYPNMVIISSPNRIEYLHGEGKQWHRSPESALARCEVIRKAKLASLQKQMNRIKSMNFTLPEPAVSTEGIDHERTKT